MKLRNAEMKLTWREVGSSGLSGLQAKLPQSLSGDAKCLSRLLTLPKRKDRQQTSWASCVPPPPMLILQGGTESHYDLHPALAFLWSTTLATNFYLTALHCFQRTDISTVASARMLRTIDSEGRNRHRHTSSVFPRP